MESLSAYARQFLTRMERPEVDHIDGLSPAISIEQKTTSHNPRSTVGTVTEIHDLLSNDGIEVDRRKIVVGEAIKTLGVHEVTVKVHTEVAATLKVWVVKA